MSTIFVSSTFRDMHQERDALQEIVLPVVNAQAVKYGQNMSFCDLRWGINTSELDSEMGAKKVLDVCLEEIDRCNPPMIVILGERYGWIPSEALVSDVATRKQIQLDHLRKSVTALEIEYGVFSRVNKDRNLLFYFREIKNEVSDTFAVEDNECKQLVAELKTRIQNIPNAKIRTYCVECAGETIVDGIDTFAQMVQEDLLEILMPQWETYNARSPFERECNNHWSFIEEKSGLFSARKKLAEEYLEHLEKNHFLIIKGVPGVGKSTMFSYLAEQLRAQEAHVLPFISGLTTESSTAEGIIKNIVYGMEDMLGIVHSKHDGDLRAYYRDLCIECRIKKLKLVVMVDAVDQLFPDNMRDELIFMPEELSESVQFVMTCIKEFSVGGRSFVDLPFVDEKEIVLIIDTLTKSHNKELDNEVIQEVLKKSSVNTPLYLTFLMYRLTLMNRADFELIQRYGSGMNAISRYQIRLVQGCPEDINDMSVELMHMVAERINNNMITQVLAYMAFSQHGLRMEDLKMLLKESFVALDFSHFIIYIKDCFIVREDGRYDFSHKSIRNGLREFYKEQKKNIHKRLFTYLKSLDADDTLRKGEIMYHCILADEKAEFANYIKESESDDTKLAFAAGNLHEICRGDDGVWILELLEFGEFVSKELLRFLDYDFWNTLSSSDKDVQLKERLYEKTYKVALSLYQFDTSESAVEILYSTIRTYGNVNYYKGERGYKDAYECYLKCSNLAEKLVVMNNSLYHRRLLALTYQGMADVYIDVCKKSVEEIYDETGDIYDFDAYKHVYDLRERVIRLCEEMYEEKDTVGNCGRLCDSYISMGKFMIKAVRDCTLEHMDEGAVKELAFEKYEMALSMAKRYVKEKEDIYMLGKMAQLYEQMSEHFLDTADEEQRQKAVDYAREKVCVLQRLLKLQHTYYNSQNLSAAYAKLAIALLNTRNETYRSEIIQLYDKAIAIQKNLAREVDSSKYRDVYATYLFEAGKVLIKERSADRISKGLKYVRQSVKIYEELSKKDPEYKEDYAKALNRLGDAKMAMVNWASHSKIYNFDKYKLDAEMHYKLAEEIFEQLGKMETCYGYAEALEAVSKMEKKYTHMIGIAVYQTMEDYAVRRYQEHIDGRALKEQNLTGKALATLAFLSDRYWINTKEERQIMRKRWADNDRKRLEERKSRRECNHYERKTY